MIVAISSEALLEKGPDGKPALRDGTEEFFELVSRRGVRLIVLLDVGLAPSGKACRGAIRNKENLVRPLIADKVKHLQFTGYPSGTAYKHLKGNNIYLCVLVNPEDVRMCSTKMRTAVFDAPENERMNDYPVCGRAYNMWGVTEFLRSMFYRVQRMNIKQKIERREQRRGRERS